MSNHKEILRGARILLTGGAGSVGRALAAELLNFSPEVIRIYDISENDIFHLRSHFGDKCGLRYLVGDIRDANRLSLAMEDIDIVVHLAAMKHVYACEYNPFEAVKINIDGLQNVINVARKQGVKKLIFSSTDKAARPTNVMGMTKLLGERLISLANNYSEKTIFTSVRFGNVIGSNGSVIPLFREQIRMGGPLTITDKKMTRFVITMQEALDLIYSAIRLAKGGETFVWKMRTARVIDIAEEMIRRFASGSKIKILEQGKGKGEKLHEEIMSDDEVSRAKELDDMYVIIPEMVYHFLAEKYKNVKPVENAVITSDMGKFMSQAEIGNLLKEALKER